MFQIFEGLKLVWSLFSSFKNKFFNSDKTPYIPSITSVKNFIFKDKMNLVLILLVAALMYIYYENNSNNKEFQEKINNYEKIMRDQVNNLILKDNDISNLKTEKKQLQDKINNTIFEKDNEIKYLNLKNISNNLDKTPTIKIIDEENNSKIIKSKNLIHELNDADENQTFELIIK